MKRRRILIVSHPLDIHARAIAYAIREKGHTAVELFCSDCPTRLNVTLGVNADAHFVSVVDRAADYADLIDDKPFHTIWMRRRRQPWLPSFLHPGDREVATRQFDRTLHDLFVLLDSPGVFWVNHFEREPTTLLKVYQLRCAAAAGLVIPDTLVSNDPEKIKHFIQKYRGGAIYKLAQHATWRRQDTGETLASYTAPITCNDLPSDEMVRLCPGIFQPLIPKHFEVRVACFGDYLMALKIESQTDERARMDWRAGQWHIPMKPYDLPDGAANAIRRFLHSTGLACASLDFIVTPAGEHVFLEANPQGQFLWMEHRTGIPVLDAASDFLIYGQRDFHYEPMGTTVNWRCFQHLWEDGGLKDSANEHVLTTETVTVPE